MTKATRTVRTHNQTAFVLMTLSLLAGQQAMADERIRRVAYADQAVVVVKGCLNFQTTIILDEEERIETMGIGDSGLWQAAATKRGNVILVKPLNPKAYSNLTVITDKRSYGFELMMNSAEACRRGLMTYELRFTFPPKPVPPPPVKRDIEGLLPPIENRQMRFSYDGSRELVPLRVFDDGKATYFKWPQGIAVPAIYTLSAEGQESLINYATLGDYIIVEQTARAFVLRRGPLLTTIYNEAFKLEALDTLSPKPRTVKKP